jgi:metal-responsive CopG/Arc/MetJ family transcriptional regulator
MRTIIELTDEQVERLKAISEREGLSRAAIVREAVDEYLGKKSDEEFERALSAVFGMWKDRGIDGVEYQRQLRAEWDRDPSDA